MESRDPEETVQHILDSMKPEETLQEEGYCYNGYTIVDNPGAGNWFIKGHEGSFSTDTEAEEFIDNALTSETKNEALSDSDNDYIMKKRVQYLRNFADKH